MALINLICKRGGAATTTTRSSQQHIATTKLETRCSSSSSSTCISERENASFRAAVRLCSRFTNAFGQLRTIATSLLQEEGEISHDIVLKLQSLDFGSVFGRQIWEALRMLNEAITTSILTVESHLAWAGTFWCWGVQHRCRLLCPLISEVRFSSARWNERTTDRIV